jgi:hypothetical protein
MGGDAISNLRILSDLRGPPIERELPILGRRTIFRKIVTADRIRKGIALTDHWAGRPGIGQTLSDASKPG